MKSNNFIAAWFALVCMAVCVQADSSQRSKLRLLADCNTAPANGTSSSNSSECDCVSGYTWSTNDDECQLDCGSIENANGFANQSQSECACETDYFWDNQTATCQGLLQALDINGTNSTGN